MPKSSFYDESNDAYSVKILSIEFDVELAVIYIILKNRALQKTFRRL